MAKKEIVIIADYNEEDFLSLNELCEVCGVSREVIDDLFRYGIIQIETNNIQASQFDPMQLERIQKALRLQHDLEINLQGIAVVLDLLDEIENLRTRTKLLEKHLLKR